MTRVIAGAAGGRRLRTPAGSGTRPTSDRVREALFSAVESWCGSLAGLQVLDLYAGSGALGLEAWSRGAAGVVLVESERRAAAVVRDNVRGLGCPVARVVERPVQRALEELAAPAGGFDLVLSDPPYDLSDDALAHDLELLADHLAPDALVVVERSARSPQPRWPARLEPGRSRRYGETTLWYGHAAPAGQHDDEPDELDAQDETGEQP